MPPRKFPVSGLVPGPRGYFKKWGFYHNDRKTILSPKWGFIHGRNKSRFPDGSGKKWSWESDLTWRYSEDGLREESLYAFNTERYLWPATRCLDPCLRGYTLEMLDPSYNPAEQHRQQHSGLGRPEVGTTVASGIDETKETLDPLYGPQARQACLGAVSTARFPRHLLAVWEDLRESDRRNGTIGNASVVPEGPADTQNCANQRRDLVNQVDIFTTQMMPARLSGLSRLTREMRIWRDPGYLSAFFSSSQGPLNPFPYVKTSASLVRNLSLHDVLFTKSNHRAACLRHPRWTHLHRVKKRDQRRYLRRRCLRFKAAASIHRSVAEAAGL